MSIRTHIILFLIISTLLIFFSVGFVFVSQSASEPDFEGYVIERNVNDRTALIVRNIDSSDVEAGADVLFDRVPIEDISWFKFQVGAMFDQIQVGDHVQIWKKTGPGVMNTSNRSYVKKVNVL